MTDVIVNKDTEKEHPIKGLAPEQINVTDEAPGALVYDKDGNLKPPGPPVIALPNPDEGKVFDAPTETTLAVSFAVKTEVNQLLDLIAKQGGVSKEKLVKELMLAGLGMQLARQREMLLKDQQLKAEAHRKMRAVRDAELARKRDEESRKAKRKAQKEARKNNR